MPNPTRPWGPEPTEPPPGWHAWVFDRANARNKEAEWKEYEDNKKGVEHQIIKFHGASHRLDEAMTRKFQDGVRDDMIPERLVTLWWDYAQYVKHGGPEYAKMRAAAWDHFVETHSMKVEGYWTAKEDWHSRYPNPENVVLFTPKKIRLSHRLLERAWPWQDSNKPVDRILWNRLLNEFATFNNGSWKNLVEFKEAVDAMFAALPPEEPKGTANPHTLGRSASTFAAAFNPHASIVDAVFEAHAAQRQNAAATGTSQAPLPLINMRVAFYVEVPGEEEYRVTSVDVTLRKHTTGTGAMEFYLEMLPRTFRKIEVALKNILNPKGRLTRHTLVYIGNDKRIPASDKIVATRMNTKEKWGLDEMAKTIKEYAETYAKNPANDKTLRIQIRCPCPTR